MLMIDSQIQVIDNAICRHIDSINVNIKSPAPTLKVSKKV